MERQKDRKKTEKYIKTERACRGRKTEKYMERQKDREVHGEAER